MQRTVYAHCTAVWSRFQSFKKYVFLNREKTFQLTWQHSELGSELPRCGVNRPCVQCAEARGTVYGVTGPAGVAQVRDLPPGHPPLSGLFCLYPLSLSPPRPWICAPNTSASQMRDLKTRQGGTGTCPRSHSHWVEFRIWILFSNQAPFLGPASGHLRNLPL